MKPIKNILFVCTGNSCRSIMAEAYMKKVIKDKDLDLEVKSAGTLGLDSLVPTFEALNILEKEGIETRGLLSKGLTEDFIRWADLILVMGSEHKDKVINMVAEGKNKVYYLGSFSSGSFRKNHTKNENPEIIPDPIGKPVEFYKSIFDLIKTSIGGVINWLDELQ